MRPGFLALVGACILSLAALSACKSQPTAIPDGLSAGEFFQHAQDASDSGDYRQAMQYYTVFQQRFPTDVAHVAWASYEIAFLYHKMGENATTLKLLDELLAKAAAEPDSVPPAVRALSEELKARLSPVGSASAKAP